MQFTVLGNRAQKTPPKASRDQLLYASSAGKTETVFRARNRLKDSSRAKDVYITQDYAKAIQQERKVLIKAMFQAKERGLSAKVIDRKLIINNAFYKVSNIPEDLRPPQSSAHA